MSSTIPYFEPSRAAVATLLASQARQSYWAYVDSVCRGRAHCTTERVDCPELLPGTVLRATDRNYVVMANGSWRRVDREGQIPRESSQIFVPHWPKRNKYAR